MSSHSEGIEVKEGRYYRSRNGSVWGPMVNNGYGRWGVPGNDDVVWLDGGYYTLSFKLNPLDLVEEVEVAPVGHLAWTQMSEGLPMEEGVTYEFLRWDRDHIRMFTRDSVTVNWPWQPVDRDDPLACDDEMALEFTHWRKVVLP